MIKRLFKQLWRLITWLPRFLARLFKKPRQGMTRRQALFIWSQHHLPQHGLSRFMGAVANLEYPVWLKDCFIEYFMKRYKIKLNEAVITDPAVYPSFNAFFTRRLRAECRPLGTSIVSPVDGTVSQIGTVTEGKIFQAKGINYTLSQLLGNREEWVRAFEGASFATLYLAPNDYHRVHMPLDGTLKEMIHVPGNLFSVNPTTVAHEDGVFARNERVVSIFQTPIGPVAVILVGAMIVGSIHTVWCGEVTPPRGYEIYAWNYTEDAPHLLKGAEMGHFQLGSTVILLFPAHKTHWVPSLTPGSKIQYGQQIART